MKIEHIAIWVHDLENMRDFYCNTFNLESNNRYHNPNKNFSSYFLSSPDGGARIELMHRPNIEGTNDDGEKIGITHLAFSLGSQEKVDQMTEQLRAKGMSILGEPRTTGDGYYESVIADPEGNRIELVA